MIFFPLNKVRELRGIKSVGVKRAVSKFALSFHCVLHVHCTLFFCLGLPETSEASSQSNQRLPSISSDTRQLSSESLESESEVGSLATVPAIMVTPVTEVPEESAEQNVPVSQAHPESLDPDVVELLEDVDALKEGDEAEVQDAEGKERLVQGMYCKAKTLVLSKT